MKLLYHYFPEPAEIKQELSFSMGSVLVQRILTSIFLVDFHSKIENHSFFGKTDRAEQNILDLRGQKNKCQRRANAHVRAHYDCSKFDYYAARFRATIGRCRLPE